MNIVEKLYENGLDLSQILRLIDKKLGKSNWGLLIIDSINFFSKHITSVAELEFNLEEAQEHQRKTLIYQKKIAGLQKMLLDDLYSSGKKGSIIGFGFNNINSPYPVAIPVHEWIFLKVDIENNKAYCNDRQYRDIKFILYEKLLPNELEELIPLIYKQQKLVEESSITEVLEIITIDKLKLEVYPESKIKKTDSKQRKREDNLTKAINAAIQQLGKKPSLEELWKYFKDDKDETGVIEDYTDTHITWIDTKGNVIDTKKSSLANRLSRIKT